MKKERSGKLINDRTESFGINFLDTVFLSIIFSVNSLILFKSRPYLGVLLTGAMYVVLSILRTTKRKYWAEEVVKYYLVREFLGGEINVNRIFRNIKN